MPPYVVRPFAPADTPPITDIYNHYVRESIATFDLDPLTPDQYGLWLSEHSSGGPHRLWVAEAPAGRILGYAGSGSFRPRRAYDRTVETSVYVAPDALGQGIGRALYAQLFDSLASENLHRIVAGISQPNPASVALHTRFGFREVGRFSEIGWKFGRYWDVAFYERPARGFEGSTAAGKG